MAAKVREWKGAYWVATHENGKRRMRRFGPTKADRERAQEAAKKINLALELKAQGVSDHAIAQAVGLPVSEPTPEAAPALPALPADLELRRWLDTYAPTLKPTTRSLVEGVIDAHLAPYFGSKCLREITETDLLGYVTTKLAAEKPKRAARTIRNDLALLRRVYNLLIRDGKLTRNPASHLGEIMRRVDNAAAAEVEQAEAWTAKEATDLLALARVVEPRFAPFLSLLFATGMRRGEAIGLKWSDVNFVDRVISVRRAITQDGPSTPKSGKARRIPMTPGLVAELREARIAAELKVLEGRAEVPEWVFPSEAGTPLVPRNVERVWYRLRRRAAKKNIRPLKLHSTRHTWATLALQAGKSVRWVAEVLGHSDPTLTLRVYAHAMREDESDLSFADFGGSEGTGRHQTAPLRVAV